jgi:hypothetical protein
MQRGRLITPSVKTALYGWRKKLGSPFDAIKTLSETKDPEGDRKDFNPYLTNRFFSQHIDTILHSNEMNTRFFLDSSIQYDYYFYAIRSRVRYGKWPKPDKDQLDKIELIAWANKISNREAKELLSLYDEDQLRILKEMRDVQECGYS